MQARNAKKWLKQTGQASIEYILVSILAVFILIKPDDQGDVPIVKLANALKTHYNAYAYAISMSDTTTLPLELIEIVAVPAGTGAVQNPVTPQNNAGQQLPAYDPLSNLQGLGIPPVITTPPVGAPPVGVPTAVQKKQFVDFMNNRDNTQEVKDSTKVLYDNNFGVGAAESALKP